MNVSFISKRLWLLGAGLLGVALAVSLPLLLLSNARAQETDLGNGLRINRIRQEFTLNPGQQEAYEIEVTNVSAGNITIGTVINDFASDDETGQPRLLTGPDESSPFSLAEYITLPEPFSLAPGESQNVNIRITLPEDIIPGGYFGAIRFAPTNLEGEEGAIALTASVGSLLLVSVPGDVQDSMNLAFLEARQQLESGQTVSRAFFETAPDVAAVGLNNSGNSILKPFGRISVKDIFGREVHSYEFNGGQIRGNVLPQSSRTFENELDNIGAIGRYTIEANLSYGEGGGNIITASSTFWVVPWRILLLVAVVVIAIIWFMTRGIKIYNRHVIERAKRR